MSPGPVVLCLTGATATGKTGLAVELRRRFPLEIVSVDSALVYRGMDIGTAKPPPDVLREAPHRLVDIRDPEETYSAGEFVRDAEREIDSILASGRTPLLVGGTMLYFRALVDGIAELPEANAAVRAEIDEEAASRGWDALHRELVRVDPDLAARIAPTDRQRIQRALEVYRASGKPLSEWQQQATTPRRYQFLRIALVDPLRARLHERINDRVHAMLARGFIDEVRRLRARPGLTADSPSMRSVGYRQIWAHLDGRCDLQTATSRAQAATRQLAKRQLTWLRSMPELQRFDPVDAATEGAVARLVERNLNQAVHGGRIA
ncbi:MAG: tRNA (adenosine(37)-N6)-dimethylallyltransferase MiaA [Woeseiaceae bacterium]|nr:tRNA (adenosine(37)-N6)-dimethylallyltransferase MiaA [Woeseiaceae bacterium]